MSDIAEKLITVANNTPAVAEAVNAAKATASGVAVRVDDVLDTEHTLQVQTAAGAAVTVTGKNLFDYTQPKASGVSDIKSRTDGIIEVCYKGANTWCSANILIPNCRDLVGKKITISGKAKTGGANNATLRIMWLTDVGQGKGSSVIASPYISSTEYVDIMQTGVIPAQASEEHRNLCLILYGNTDAIITNGEHYAWYKDIQIEIGETATDFEPYKAPQAATADSSGNVPGLRSVSPAMTVFAGNGETVQCTYFPQAAAGTYAKYQELKQAEITLKELTENG